VTVAGQQKALFGGALRDDGGVGQTALGDRRVIARRAQPAAEPGQHLVAEEAQRRTQQHSPPVVIPAHESALRAARG
jgi:hypothetical protein